MTYKHRENHATKMKKPEFRFKIKDADPKGRFWEAIFSKPFSNSMFSWPFHIALCIRLPTLLALALPVRRSCREATREGGDPVRYFFSSAVSQFGTRTKNDFPSPNSLRPRPASSANFNFTRFLNPSIRAEFKGSSMLANGGQKIRRSPGKPRTTLPAHGRGRSMPTRPGSCKAKLPYHLH